MIGVNFQPGGGSGGEQPKPQSNGVQEAIKVLSLRLPKVVGAQGISPQGLLESPGSGGNPRVDSVVNSILSKMFPTGQPQQAPQSFGMANAPDFSGFTQPAYQPQKQQTAVDQAGVGFRTPRVVFDNPTTGAGDFSIPPGGFSNTSPFGNTGGVYGSLPGADYSQPPASIAPTPQWPQASDPYPKPYEI